MSTRAGYAGLLRRSGPLRCQGVAARERSGSTPRLADRPAMPGPTRRAPPQHPRPSEEFHPVPSNKQRRQAAQRRLQRQLERRAELARKRRRNVLIGVTAAAVVLVVATVLLITGIGGDDTDPAAAEPTPTSSAPTSSAAAPTTNSDGTVACTYTPDGSGSEDVGTPPNPERTPTQGTADLRMSTDQGDLTLTLDRTKAPCTSASLVHLTERGFYDNTPCHRLVVQSNLGVLQCGDPTGSGSGGPGYQMSEEGLTGATYPRGTVAMAN